MQARLVRQVLMSGVKDRFTLRGTKKNREDLSIDQRLRNVFVPQTAQRRVDWLADHVVPVELYDRVRGSEFCFSSVANTKIGQLKPCPLEPGGDPCSADV